MLPVGSIVASFLSERHFKEEMHQLAPHQVWDLATSEKPIPKGRLLDIVRNVPEYIELNPNNVATLPDLRGMFLRGLHGSRPTEGDQGDAGNPTRLVGSLQQDAFGNHDHYVSKTFPTSPYAPDLDAGRQTHASTGWPPPDGNGYPVARTDSVGEKETRPRNVAVNYFVRVA